MGESPLPVLSDSDPLERKAPAEAEPEPTPPKEGLSDLPPDADTSLLSNPRKVTLVGHTLVVGATRDHVEYTFEVTGAGADAETFTTRFSHAKSVHDQLFAQGALDRLADSSLSFPTHWSDGLKDMTHDEGNVQRRGEELRAYYTELFQKHGRRSGTNRSYRHFERRWQWRRVFQNHPKADRASRTPKLAMPLARASFE